MRIAMATLADATNTREGMLNVLSAGVTSIIPNEYPSVLGVDLALMIELGQTDLETAGSSTVVLKVTSPGGEVIAETAGSMSWDAGEIWPQNLPAAISLHSIFLPEPGRYTIAVSVPGLEEVVLTLNAAEPPGGGSSDEGKPLG